MNDKFRNKDIEKLLMLYANNYTDKEYMRGPDCPGDMRLSEYVCGMLDKSEKKDVDRHLADCNFCLATVVDIYRSTQVEDDYADEHNISDELFERIKDLVPGRDITDTRAEILFEDKIKCSNCGSRLAPSHSYCFNCGEPVFHEDDDEVKKLLDSDFFPEAIKKNRWLVLSLATIFASFGFPSVFLQFLVVGGIFGGKWILSTEAIKELRKIHFYWKEGKKDEAEKERDRLKERFDINQF